MDGWSDRLSSALCRRHTCYNVWDIEPDKYKDSKQYDEAQRDITNLRASNRLQEARRSGTEKRQEEGRRAEADGKLTDSYLSHVSVEPKFLLLYFV